MPQHLMLEVEVVDGLVVDMVSLKTMAAVDQVLSSLPSLRSQNNLTSTKITSSKTPNLFQGMKQLFGQTQMEKELSQSLYFKTFKNSAQLFVVSQGLTYSISLFLFIHKKVFLFCLEHAIFCHPELYFMKRRMLFQESILGISIAMPFFASLSMNTFILVNSFVETSEFV